MSAAFALGWQMAGLYRDPHLHRARQRSEPVDLPGYSDLTASERTEIGLDQIEAGINRLWLAIGAAGLERPDTAAVAAAFDAAGGRSGSIRDLRWAVVGLHVELMEKLLAADFRLGKAYGLGRALADTGTPPATEGASPREAFERALGHWRLESVRQWLADLDSTLPPHAAKAVRASIDSWEEWAAAPLLDGRPIDWDEDGNAVRLALRRQAQLWRALLSGEKSGTDMLHADDYLRATRELLSRAGHFAAGLVLHLWFVLLPALVLLVAAIVLLATSDRTATDLAAVGAFLVGLGITWQSVGAAAARLGDHLKQPLWGAALNVAIADAITELPRSQPSG